MEKLRIKEILKLKGLTMIQLAEKLEINRVNLSSSINGNPTLKSLLKIAEILEVDVSELFAKPNTKNQISGYLEYNAEIYKIERLSDVESFIEMVNSKSIKMAN
jgi:transcriptional regulator with XRE-family HTH domain